MSPLDILDWQRRVIADVNISHAAKTVATTLSHRVNGGTGGCFPSRSRIGQDAGGLTDRSVRRSLAALEAAGYISRDLRPGSTSVYRLATPDSNQRGDASVPPHEVSNPQGGTAVSPHPGQQCPPRGDSSVPLTNEGTNEVNWKSTPALRDGRAPPAARGEEKKKTPTQASPQPRPRPAPHPIPQDWTPDAASQEWIAAFGVTAEEAKPVICEFRDYWKGRTQCRADWQLAFRRNSRAEGALIRLRNATASRPQARPMTPASGPCYRNARDVLAEIYG